MNRASVLWFCLALLVLLRGLFSVLPPLWGWGLDVQRFLDPVMGWGLWGLSAALLLPIASKPLAAALEPVGSFLMRSNRSFQTAGVAGAFLAWLMPDRAWFVGDFLMRQGNVESNFLASNYWGALPLDTLLHYSLLRPFGFGSPEAANTALRVLGAVEAGALGILSVFFSRALGIEGAPAAAASGIVFFGGYLTMFTGLGKPASELCLVVVAIAAFGVRAVRGYGGLLPVSLALAAGYALHRSSVILTPTWLVIAWVWLRHQPKPGVWKRATTWAAILVPIAVAAYTFPFIASFAMRYDLSHHILTSEAQRAGLLSAALSPRHLHGLANLLAALSPLFIVVFVLPLWGTRDLFRSLEARVLVTLAASFLPALLFIHPQQGIFRDWDVFASAGVALSSLSAYLIVDCLRKSSERAWLLVPVVASVLVPSLQWLAVNSDADRGLSRVTTYLVEDQTPSDLQRTLTWDFLTSRYFRLRRWPEAAAAAEQTAELAPHRRILLIWALAETMKQDYPAAERAYRQLLSRNPGDPLGLIGLAGVAARLNDEVTVRETLGKLRAFGPDSPQTREIRTHVRYYPQVWPIGDWQ